MGDYVRLQEANQLKRFSAQQSSIQENIVYSYSILKGRAPVRERGPILYYWFGNNSKTRQILHDNVWSTSRVTIKNKN
jgi:hypothetical protein